MALGQDSARGVRSTSKRMVAIIVCLLTLFVMLYSVFFPLWLYGLLFDSANRNSEFFWYGLGHPFDGHPGMSVGILVLALALALIAYNVRRSSQFCENHWGKICFGCLCAFIIIGASVYAFCKGEYLDAGKAQHFAHFERGSVALFQQMGQPQVPDAPYFRYLDTDQIQALYGEIEPEWLNKQRTVTDSTSASGSANLGPLGVAGSVGSQQQIVQESPTAAPARDCISVMRYVLDKGQARGFSTGTDWLVLSLIEVLSSITPQKPQDVPLPLNSGEIALDNHEKNWPDNSAETNRRMNDELAKHNWAAELSGLLTNLPPYVFVQGKFVVDRSPALTLIHTYVGNDGNLQFGMRFRPVEFDIDFPPTAKLPELKKGSSLNGTVFGKPEHPLESGGVVVQVRALALFQ